MTAEQVKMEINWQDAQWKAMENGCSYTEVGITVTLPTALTLRITAHYPGSSHVMNWIDASYEPSTFYQRAEQKMKEKYPGAIYSYLIPSDEETAIYNEQMWNQIWTYEHKKDA